MAEWTPERIAAVRQCLVRLEQLGLSHPLYDALAEIERLRARVAELEGLLRECKQLAGKNWMSPQLAARIDAKLEGAVGIPDFQSAWQRREELLQRVLNWFERGEQGLGGATTEELMEDIRTELEGGRDG